MDPWVMGPPWIRRVLTFHAIQMKGLSENSLLAMSATMSVPRARDAENHFPARYDEADQLAKFLTIGGHRKVINNRNWLYRQGSTMRCLHKQGIIAAQIIYITRKIKQTNGKEDVVVWSNRPMEGEKWWYTSITCICFPREKQSKIYLPSLYWHLVNGGCRW